MQKDQGKLRIHTAVRPEDTPQEEQQATPVASEASDETVRFSRRRTRRAFTARTKGKPDADRLTTGERLLRNAAVACALFLSVMALKNVDQPWSRKATDSVRAAMNMRIDWDETLGQLSFVRALVPETALVFFHLGAESTLMQPVEGWIEHEFSQQQPWLEYRCEGQQPVCAAMDGTVTAVGQGAGGDWSVLLTGKEGDETVYGYLDAVYVEVGQPVEAGQQLGVTEAGENSRLYFEWREEGVSKNPDARPR